MRRSASTSCIAMAGNAGVEALDQLIHERRRLGIVSALAANDSMTFGELKELLGTTDGNLSVHARRLEEAGYIKVTKGFADRRPRTEYQLTREGRRALERYVEMMETIVTATRDALERT